MAEPTYSFYTDSYLKTHTELVQQSIVMAQQEFETQLQIIQFYDKQLSKMKYGTEDGKSSFQTKPTLVYRSKKDYRDSMQKEIDIVETQTVNLGVDLVAAKNVAKSLIRGKKSPSQALTEIAQSQGYKEAGGSLYQKRLIAKKLVNTVAAAAAEAGQPVKLPQLIAAAEASLNVTGFTVGEDVLKANEITSRQSKLEPISTTGQSKSTSGGKTTNVDFSMSDVELKEDGTLVFKNGTVLTVEQERIYKLQDKINKLNTRFEESYGEEFTIDDMIERGREIYRDNYAPMSAKQQKKLDNEQRAEFVSGLNQQQQNIFNALESVNADDKRIKDYFSGNYKLGDKFYETVDQIVQAGKNGQQINPADLVNTLYPDDADKARDALGIAMQVQMQNLAGTKIKPMKEVKEEDFGEGDVSPLDYKAQNKADYESEFGDLEAAKEGFMDFLAGRTKGPAPAKNQAAIDKLPKEETANLNPLIPVTPEEVPAVVAPVFDASIYTQQNPYATMPYKKGSYSYFVKPDGSLGMIGTTGNLVDLTDSKNAAAAADAQLELDKLKQKLQVK